MANAGCDAATSNATEAVVVVVRTYVRRPRHRRQQRPTGPISHLRIIVTSVFDEAEEEEEEEEEEDCMQAAGLPSDGGCGFLPTILLIVAVVVQPKRTGFCRIRRRRLRANYFVTGLRSADGRTDGRSIDTKPRTRIATK
jgi:hypothetical protein